MAYTTFDQSGSTLSDAERMDEAKRILRRISGSKHWVALRDCKGLTEEAVSFVNEKLAQLELFDSVGAITIKQLYFLRDINSKVD